MLQKRCWGITARQPLSFMWDPVEPDQLPLASSVSAVAAGQYFSANNPSPDKLESNIASDCIPSQSRGWTLITLISSSVLQASKALAVSLSDHVYVHGTYTHFFFLFQLSCVW